MTLNAGDTGYGSVPGRVVAAAEGDSESATLLVPDPVPAGQWRPMTMEELQLKAGGPGWRKVRCYLVLLFWLAWLAMLATSIAIIATSPRPQVTPLRWWQKCVFYQLQPELLMEQTGGVDGEYAELLSHRFVNSNNFSDLFLIIEKSKLVNLLSLIQTPGGR